jgi:hypothetical protein
VVGVAAPHRPPAARETATPVTVFDEAAHTCGDAVAVVAMFTITFVAVARSAPAGLQIDQRSRDAVCRLREERGQLPMALGQVAAQRGELVTGNLGDDVGDRVVDLGPPVFASGR